MFKYLIIMSCKKTTLFISAKIFVTFFTEYSCNIQILEIYRNKTRVFHRCDKNSDIQYFYEVYLLCVHFHVCMHACAWVCVHIRQV